MERNTIVRRFWAKVQVCETDSCWNWLGALDKDGYGRFSYNKDKKSESSNRVALELKLKRPILAGYKACHTCDNTSCVNPKHLYEGTVLDNIKDRVLRHRSACGEQSGVAKLSNKDVIEIRKLGLQEKSTTKIGKIFGITRLTVYRITSRKLWRHIG